MDIDLEDVLGGEEDDWGEDPGDFPGLPDVEIPDEVWDRVSAAATDPDAVPALDEVIPGEDDWREEFEAALDDGVGEDDEPLAGVDLAGPAGGSDLGGVGGAADPGMAMYSDQELESYPDPGPDLLDMGAPQAADSLAADSDVVGQDTAGEADDWL